VKKKKLRRKTIRLSRVFYPGGEKGKLKRARERERERERERGVWAGNFFHNLVLFIPLKRESNKKMTNLAHSINALFGKGEKILPSPLHFFKKQSTSKHSNFISHQ